MIFKKVRRLMWKLDILLQHFLRIMAGQRNIWLQIIVHILGLEIIPLSIEWEITRFEESSPPGDSRIRPEVGFVLLLHA